MTGDQFALDGMAETLFELGPGDESPRAETRDKPARVFDDDGTERCASCYSELRNGRCARCSSLHVSAQEMVGFVDGTWTP